MIIQPDPIRTLFVDRDEERKKFLRIIAGESNHRILTIRAGPGMGKTWLVKQFGHECNYRELPYACVDFSARSQYSYLEVLRSIRDALGAQNFNEFTSLVNEYYIRPNPFQNFSNQSSSSSVEIHSSLQESAISGVAGRDIIRDNNFFFTRPDIPPELLRSNLTASFKQCLKTMMKSLPADKWIVWQFDTFEKIDPITREWLFEEFLREIKEQTLRHLIIIIAGQEVPTLALDWKPIASQYVLEPLSLSDYQEYLGRTKMTLELSRIKALHKRYFGRPLDLAMWVDAASPTDDEE